MPIYIHALLCLYANSALLKLVVAMCYDIIDEIMLKADCNACV